MCSLFGMSVLLSIILSLLQMQYPERYQIKVPYIYQTYYNHLLFVSILFSQYTGGSYSQKHEMSFMCLSDTGTCLRYRGTPQIDIWYDNCEIKMLRTEDALQYIANSNDL